MEIHFTGSVEDWARVFQQNADEVLERLTALNAQGETFMATTKEALDGLKADLDAVNTDLDAIKDGVTRLGGQQQQLIADLQAQVAALTAGDALTAEQASALQATADTAKANADALVQLVAPPLQTQGE